MQEKPKVLLFQRIIPVYRSEVFRKLSEQLNITVCYSEAKKGSSIKNAQGISSFALKLKRIYFGKSQTLMMQFPFLNLLKHKPKIVILEGSISYLTRYLLMILKPFFGYRIIIWTHGLKNNELEQPFQNFEGKVRLKLLNLADAIILYSNGRKEKLEKYIPNNKKIFVANNTMGTSSLNEIYNDLCKRDKDFYRKDLNMNSELQFIFIGRLIKSKKVDILIYTILKDDNNFNLTIIGDGPELNELKKITNNSPKIKFVGSIFDDKIIGKYLFAVDYMISFGDLGLSIVHAFAFACPVITVSSNHGPEFEYLKSNYNGIVLQDKKLNYNELSKINKVQLSKNARTTFENDAPLQKMIDGFDEAIEFAVNLKNEN